MTVHQSYSAVFKKDAAAVLFYVEQMQYEIGSRDGELVRRKIGKEKVESYRYEDLIDDVDIWIFGKILELNALRDDCRNDIERAVHESEYQRLKEDERRVGKLYEKTCYGKAVDVLADRLAEKLFDNILKGKEMLTQYCKAKSINMIDIMKPEFQNLVMRKYGFKIGRAHV